MRNRPQQAGFTLIELVASAVLTSIMMTAIVGIVWSTLKQTQQLKRNETQQVSAVTLAGQLRIDLQNARGMQIEPNGITLHGFLARDNTSRNISLRVGRVRYALRKVNNKRMLARRSDGGPWEPLWIDFGAISIDPLSFREADDDDLPMAETGGLTEIPESFRITVRSDNGTIIWREVIQHHEN
jgi:prepilin-type N-terminal cleavage/methylation domain-containing protein